MRAEPALAVWPTRLRVALAASEPIVARRLTAALGRDGLEAHPETEDAEAVVLSCTRMDEAELESLRALRAERPEAALVVVAGEAAHRDVREGLDAGADGFVLESRVEECLAETVRAACSGQLVLPREWRRRFAGPVLSSREKQVLGMVVMGFTNQEIANKLLVAKSTVKSHLTSIFAKLGVRGRNEATALVLDPESGLGTGVLAILNGGPDLRARGPIQVAPHAERG
jgi:DNA-binding NarL/FixJ family response regulator